MERDASNRAGLLIRRLARDRLTLYGAKWHFGRSMSTLGQCDEDSCPEAVVICSQFYVVCIL